MRQLWRVIGRGCVRLAGVQDGRVRACGQENAGSHVESRLHKNFAYLRGGERLLPHYMHISYSGSQASPIGRSSDGSGRLGRSSACSGSEVVGLQS